MPRLDRIVPAIAPPAVATFVQALRNGNAHRKRRFYAASADREIVKEPVYDVRVLDKLVTRVAREFALWSRLSSRRMTLNIDKTPIVLENDAG